MSNRYQNKPRNQSPSGNGRNEDSRRGRNEDSHRGRNEESHRGRNHSPSRNGRNEDSHRGRNEESHRGRNHSPSRNGRNEESPRGRNEDSHRGRNHSPSRNGRNEDSHRGRNEESHRGRNHSPARRNESQVTRRNHHGEEQCLRAKNGRLCRPGTCSKYPCNRTQDKKNDEEESLPPVQQRKRTIPTRPYTPYVFPTQRITDTETIPVAGKPATVPETIPVAGKPATVPETIPVAGKPATVPETIPVAGKPAETTTTGPIARPSYPAPPPPTLNTEAKEFNTFIKKFLPLINEGKYEKLYSDIQVIKNYLSVPDNKMDYDGHLDHYVNMLYGIDKSPLPWFNEILSHKLFDFKRLNNHLMAGKIEDADLKDLYHTTQYGLWQLFKTIYTKQDFNLYTFNGLIMCEVAAKIAVNMTGFVVPQPSYQFWSNQDFAGC